MTTIKVYANCLRSDIEYKTLSITYETTCHQVVQNLLNKYRMRHRDPKLFYMTMEVTVRRANVKTVLSLDEDARPAVLQSCHPRGDSRFSLQTRRGGLVKIYDSALMSGSKYKSLLISDRTTVDELIQMLLSCYNSTERVEQFSLYEVCEGEEYHRKLHPDDSPLKVTQKWTSIDRHLRIRRNPDYNPHRRKSMWVSDTTITTALSRLHLHQNHKIHHLSQQSLNNTSKTNSDTTSSALAANSHCMLFRQCAKKKNCNLSSNNNNNNNNNNTNNINNNINNNNKHHHNHNYQSNVVKSITTTMPTMNDASKQDCKCVLPYTKKLSNLMPQSLPSTPLLMTKHIGTPGYANYENYLYI
ncbi:hypothetical protein PV325_002545 [Microctonus aethiopoides]|nr:hypothetical protein PV325_002545 [Microctonus aethiopoides]